MYAEIDDNQLFMAQTDENTGIPLPTAGFYQPKWRTKDKKWTEGMPKAEREALKKHSAQVQAKQTAKESIESLTVVVDTFVFKANDTSRGRMSDAIEFAKNNNQTTTVWRLADGSKQTITLEQLIKARDASIAALGNLVVGTGSNSG